MSKFGDDLDNFYLISEKKAVERIKSTAKSCFYSVRSFTPVLTGRAKSNWIVGTGDNFLKNYTVRDCGFHSEKDSDFDEVCSYYDSVFATTLSEGDDVISAWSIIGEDINIENGIWYSQLLEGGWSKKGSKMVEKTLELAILKLKTGI